MRLGISWEWSVHYFAIAVRAAGTFRHDPTELGIIGADGRYLVVGIVPPDLRARGRVVQVDNVVNTIRDSQRTKRV